MEPAESKKRLEAFANSRSLTLGVELELQIVSTHDYDLIDASPDLLRSLEGQTLPGDIKPEITASMIELSTGVCTDYPEVLDQLHTLRDALVTAADRLNVALCGGGTHPFQHWANQRISDAPRYQYLSEIYGYLAKQFTVFGQHVHIGCAGPDEALSLSHCLSRYVPHCIVLAAASPYVQGFDTGFCSARINSVAAFPMSGHIPFVETWVEFERFFDKMTDTGVVKSMKDFYWDIRPKPEFGTIEVRVMDTPLTITRAAELAAFIQAVSRWFLTERPFRPDEDDYMVYTFNRFQAARFGLHGVYVDPQTHERRTLQDEILGTLARIEHHAGELRAEEMIRSLRRVAQQGGDADWIRAMQTRESLLPEVVRLQCLRWRGD